MTSAAAVPVTAEELTQFVDHIRETTGFTIEYGDHCLYKDNWALDHLTDLNYVDRLRTRLQMSKARGEKESL